MAADLRRPTGLPLLIAVLLTAATMMFVWGALAERTAHHDQHIATPAAVTTEGGESSEQHAAESGPAPTSAVTEPASEAEYHPLGINLESHPLIAAAAVASLLLAAAVALRPRRVTLGVLLAVAAAFAVLEVVEVVHQANQDRPGLLALALAAGVLHAAAAVVAGLLLAQPRRPLVAR